MEQPHSWNRQYLLYKIPKQLDRLWQNMIVQIVSTDSAIKLEKEKGELNGMHHSNNLI